MKTFTLRVEMGNDAMQTNDDIADALERVSRHVRTGTEYGRIKDTNGNTVGEFEISEED